MASSILGKRTRSCASAATSQSRTKRQNRTEVFVDVNENPFLSSRTRASSPDDGSMDVDDDSGSVSTRTRSTPTKYVMLGKQNLLASTSKQHFEAFQNNNDENVMPLQNPTPQTPRHRDVISKKLLVTPRHRVLVTGKPFSPRTPRTPLTPGASMSTVYGQARALFTRSNESGRLVGREPEKEELSTFLQTCITKKTGGCTYVSGPPGTGKSAMVNEVTSAVEATKTVQKTYINCMSIKSSGDLYGNLLEAFCGDMEIKEGDEVKTLQSVFVPKKKSSTVYIITLDEIDHILTLDLEILYKLFEWSLQKSSRLALIGIANALDLTDRFLPRLKARSLKPELLPFLPYSATQIKTVITTRLKSLVPENSATPDYIPFLHPMAIDLCSRKVANQSGDLRRAFDICRRAIDLVESETKQKHEEALREQSEPSSPSKKPLEENINLSSLASLSPTSKQAKKYTLAQSLATLTVETAPRATVGHVNKITLATFSNGANQRLKTLNIQQKAALCALVALEKRKREMQANVGATPSKTRNLAPTVKKLYDVYCMLCRQDSVLHPLTSTEFRDVIGSLETLSLIGAVDGRNGSFVGMAGRKAPRKFGSGVGIGDEKRVSAFVSEKEVTQAAEGLGSGILKSILNGEGLD